MSNGTPDDQMDPFQKYLADIRAIYKLALYSPFSLNLYRVSVLLYSAVMQMIQMPTFFYSRSFDSTVCLMELLVQIGNSISPGINPIPSQLHIKPPLSSFHLLRLSYLPQYILRHSSITSSDHTRTALFFANQVSKSYFPFLNFAADIIHPYPRSQSIPDFHTSHILAINPSSASRFHPQFFPPLNLSKYKPITSHTLEQISSRGTRDYRPHDRSLGKIGLSTLPGADGYIPFEPIHSNPLLFLSFEAESLSHSLLKLLPKSGRFPIPAELMACYANIFLATSSTSVYSLALLTLNQFFQKPQSSRIAFSFLSKFPSFIPTYSLFPRDFAIGCAMDEATSSQWRLELLTPLELSSIFLFDSFQEYPSNKIFRGDVSKALSNAPGSIRSPLDLSANNFGEFGHDILTPSSKPANFPRILPLQPNILPHLSFARSYTNSFQYPMAPPSIYSGLSILHTVSPLRLLTFPHSRLPKNFSALSKVTSFDTSHVAKFQHLSNAILALMHTRRESFDSRPTIFSHNYNTAHTSFSERLEMERMGTNEDNGYSFSINAQISGFGSSSGSSSGSGSGEKSATSPGYKIPETSSSPASDSDSDSIIFPFDPKKAVYSSIHWFQPHSLALLYHNHPSIFTAALFYNQYFRDFFTLPQFELPLYDLGPLFIPIVKRLSNLYFTHNPKVNMVPITKFFKKCYDQGLLPYGFPASLRHVFGSQFRHSNIWGDVALLCAEAPSPLRKLSLSIPHPNRLGFRVRFKILSKKGSYYQILHENGSLGLVKHVNSMESKDWLVNAPFTAFSGFGASKGSVFHNEFDGNSLGTLGRRRRRQPLSDIFLGGNSQSSITHLFNHFVLPFHPERPSIPFPIAASHFLAPLRSLPFRSPHSIEYDPKVYLFSILALAHSTTSNLQVSRTSSLPREFMISPPNLRIKNHKAISSKIFKDSFLSIRIDSIDSWKHLLSVCRGFFI